MVALSSSRRRLAPSGERKAGDDNLSLPRSHAVEHFTWLCTALVVALELIRPPVYESARWIIATGLILAGAAHGTLDGWIAMRVLPRAGARFYLGYVVAAALMAGLWRLHAPTALLLFIVLSAYHFGEGDLRHLRPRRGAHLLFLSRGLLIVVVPLLLYGRQVLPVLAAMGVDLPAVSAQLSWALTGALLSLHAAILHAAILHATVVTPARGLREAVNLLILTALLIGAHPLISFAVYFVFWHSVDHIRSVRRTLGPHLSLGQLAIRALPILIASVLGSVALWLIVAKCDPKVRWAVLFVTLAAVTLPHSLLVSRLPMRRAQLPI